MQAELNQFESNQIWEFVPKQKDSHLCAIKCIFRYLRGSKIVGLWYPKNDCFDLVGYSDADHAGSQLDRKSTLVLANS